MIEFVEEETVDDKLDTILDKLNHMDFHGKVIMSEPYRMSGDEKLVRLELTRKEVKQEVRKLTETDWLNILNYYKMLLDGFKRADWEDDNVREQVASTMIKKTKEFFESNYPDLIEVKKRPIFDKDDFK